MRPFGSSTKIVLLCAFMTGLQIVMEAGNTSAEAPGIAAPAEVTGPFLRVTGLDNLGGPLVFRLGATRPEQTRRNFHIIRVLGHLSTVFTPVPAGPSAWDYREEAESSGPAPKLQAPVPMQKAEAASLAETASGRPGEDLEVDATELGDRQDVERHLEYNEAGKPKWEAHYRKGVGEGRYTEWHANGKKKVEGQFQNNLGHGTFTEWDENGQVVAVREYADGILTKTTLYDHGKPRQEAAGVLDFKYHMARMERGYLPIPVAQAEKDWGQSWEACRPDRLLKPGESSATVDLRRCLPFGERSYHLYIRAFKGADLGAVRTRIRVDLFRLTTDGVPVGSVETFSGFLGLRLSGMDTPLPRLETMEMAYRRFRDETRQILDRRHGREIVVGPQATPQGQGTPDSPADLQSVLAATEGPLRAEPGDTIWLRGGVYTAPGWLTSDAQKRIQKKERTASQKELPAVSTIGSDSEITEEEVEKDLSAPAETEAEPTTPPTAWLASPPKDIAPFLDYYFHALMVGTPDNPILVRQMPGERAILNGALQVNSPYTWFWGFEITEPDDRANTTRARSSVTAQTPGARFINLHVQRGAQAFALWSSAPDTELYGCIMHDWGYDAEDRGHGHGIYTQNDHGMKWLVDNVMFHGYGWNLHAYTEGGEVFNYYIEGNFSFSAGMKKPGQVTDNWLIMTMKPAHRMYFLNNLGYHPDVFSRGVRFISWGYDTELVLRGNYFLGSTQAMDLGRWQSVTCQDNFFWATERLVNASPADPANHPDAYVWDGNTYVPPGAGKAFRFHSSHGDFGEWKHCSGFDAHGRLEGGTAGRPEGTRVFVRPNFYEAGRAHVGVLNWAHQAAVNVDFSSFLKEGQPFQVFHVANLSEPVVSGRYEGGPVPLPRRGTAFSPDFDAFLVVPVTLPEAPEK